MRAVLAIVLFAAACTPAPVLGESPTFTAVAANETFWSCPAARITYVQLPPVRAYGPPSDVWADPQRRALWQKDHPSNGLQYVTGGCGKVGHVRCLYDKYYVDDYGQATDGWSCSAYDLVPEGLRPEEAAEPLRIPTALATLAAQLDARRDALTAKAARELSEKLAPQSL